MSLTSRLASVAVTGAPLAGCFGGGGKSATSTSCQDAIGHADKTNRVVDMYPAYRLCTGAAEIAQTPIAGSAGSRHGLLAFVGCEGSPSSSSSAAKTAPRCRMRTPGSGW